MEVENKSIELVLRRISSKEDDTIGELIDENHIFFCNTLEDEKREIKVAHETRIPAGRYRLGMGPMMSGLTGKYLNDKRLKPWFKRHIQVLNVPNFQGIYIHIGNNEKNTDGCILLGIWHNNSLRTIEDSVKTYKAFYLKYFPLIEQGIEVYLTIQDIS